jgi:hypothetical protein
MRNLSIILIILIVSMTACVTDPVYDSVIPDLTLDELQDKTEYMKALVIDSKYFKGEPVVKVLVNGIEAGSGVIPLSRTGFYRLEIFQGNSASSTPAVIRVVILHPDRGETEWGLPPWFPVHPEDGMLDMQSVKLLHAPAVPQNRTIPLVVILEDELTRSDSYLYASVGMDYFRIKRGVGSVQIPPNASQFGLSIEQQNFQLNIGSIDTLPQILSGELTADLQLEAGSYIHIPADLTIPEGITLQIDSACFITVASGVNIYNNGQIVLKGSAGAPVTLTCNDGQAYWGGFIGNSTGNRIDATYTIFSRSGYNTGGEYAYGHAGRQALFYSENGELKLDHCYMIDHIGQVFYPLSCILELSDCLVQRAKSGGQINESELRMDRCIFTDFPDDSFDYRDEDNDALYLNETNAVITNSVFMFAKDDGLDSGASGGGTVLIDKCRFEANFHEGAALSSGSTVYKLHRINNSLFTNNGQGLELGYSSPNHRVEVDSCRFFENGIGIRYGDCYEMPHHGYIHVSNSQSTHNAVKDVWNMNREHWAADTSHMSFENVVVTIPDPMYPGLLIND